VLGCCQALYHHYVTAAKHYYRHHHRHRQQQSVDKRVAVVAFSPDISTKVDGAERNIHIDRRCGKTVRRR